MFKIDIDKKNIYKYLDFFLNTLMILPKCLSFFLLRVYATHGSLISIFELN